MNKTLNYSALAAWLFVFTWLNVICLGGPVESSWRVRVPESDGTSYGSGTAVGPRCVITNCHVSPRVSQSANCSIYKPQTGEEYQCQTVAIDPARDLALVWVCDDSVTLDYVELAETTQAATLTNYGYGGDGILCSGTGRPLGNESRQSGVGVFSFSIGLRSGDSGGGVFNEQDELVAVQWGTDGQRGVSTGIGDVRAFLTNFTEQTQCQGPWCPLPPRGGIVPGGGRPMVPVTPQAPSQPPSIPQTKPLLPDCSDELQEIRDALQQISQRIDEQNSQCQSLAVEINTIKQELTDVRAEIVAVSIEGGNGKPGEDGRGIQAIQFIDGDLIVTYSDGSQQILEGFTTELAKQLPPIYPQWVDNEDNVIDSIPGGVRLGQTMPMRIEARVIDAISDQIIEAINARTQPK